VSPEATAIISDWPAITPVAYTALKLLVFLGKDPRASMPSLEKRLAVVVVYQDSSNVKAICLQSSNLHVPRADFRACLVLVHLDESAQA
jgi:hypothetical protein